MKYYICHLPPFAKVGALARAWAVTMPAVIVTQSRLANSLYILGCTFLNLSLLKDTYSKPIFFLSLNSINRGSSQISKHSKLSTKPPHFCNSVLKKALFCTEHDLPHWQGDCLFKCVGFSFYSAWPLMKGPCSWWSHMIELVIFSSIPLGAIHYFQHLAIYFVLN